MIKEILLPVLLILLLGFQSCSVLEQTKEYERFIECKFSVSAVEVKEIAGISMENLDNLDDLGIAQMMTITQRLFTGELPAKIEIGLRATNNNPKQASISGMEWITMLKEEELLSGYIQDEVVVPPGSSTTFTVVANLDLMRLLKSESFQDIAGFVFSNDKKAEMRKIGASLRIKPYYKVGSNIHKYPGYLTIHD